MAVRLGVPAAKAVYTALLVVSYAVAVAAAPIFGRAAWGALAGLPVAVHALLILRRADGSESSAGLLAATGRLQLISGLGLAAGLALTG